MGIDWRFGFTDRGREEDAGRDGSGDVINFPSHGDTLGAGPLSVMK